MVRLFFSLQLVCGPGLPFPFLSLSHTCASTSPECAEQTRNAAQRRQV
jgi:hypothetical protein